MRTSTYWLCSVVASALAIVSIVALWSQTGRIDTENFTRVNTPADLSNFLNDHKSGSANERVNVRDRHCQVVWPVWLS